MRDDAQEALPNGHDSRRGHKLPCVLVIEDDPWLQETYADLLQGIATVQAALTLEEAKALFGEIHENLAAIVVDACVPGPIPNTASLVRKMRAAGFNRPIIATSSDPDYRWDLMRAGCSHQCDKKDVIHFLQALLNYRPRT